ncbi:flagellar motor protein [Burkholderiaceae bacterium DAT-1]|nr:flagellar motor protein [Burkholderiaceae bacterium DAT-1]
MDKLSLIGVMIGLIAILGGQMLEGGHIQSLLQVTAFLIVIGGTLGAVLLQSTLDDFKQGLRMLRWVVQPPVADMEGWIIRIVNWSHVSRRGGLLALEAPLAGEADPFAKRGLQMLVDGTEPDTIRQSLDLDISMLEHKLRNAAKIWESAGGYAPTIGILGAVMGLIHTMENLTDPSKLGGGIAVAFVATIYGVGSANMFFLPVSNKLRHAINTEIKKRELILEGLGAIANGENPRVIENRLRAFIN